MRRLRVATATSPRWRGCSRSARSRNSGGPGSSCSARTACSSSPASRSNAGCVAVWALDADHRRRWSVRRGGSGRVPGLARRAPRRDRRLRRRRSRSSPQPGGAPPRRSCHQRGVPARAGARGPGDGREPHPQRRARPRRRNGGRRGGGVGTRHTGTAAVGRAHTSRHALPARHRPARSSRSTILVSPRSSEHAEDTARRDSPRDGVLPERSRRRGRRLPLDRRRPGPRLVRALRQQRVHDDGRELDPHAIESIVLQHMPDGTKKVASAMYILNPGRTLADAPDIAGTLTPWHDHQNLCWDDAGHIVGHPRQRRVPARAEPSGARHR